MKLRSYAEIRRRAKRYRREIRQLEPLDSDTSSSMPLLDWCKRYTPSFFPVPFSRFHRWLAAELDACCTRRGSRQNILAPRGAAKSTLVSFAYPLREALSNREAYIIIVSDTLDQAKTFLRQIRTQIEDNELLRADYPDSAGRGPIWKDHHIRLRNGVELLALGTGGKIRGRKSTQNRRPTLIVCDDPQNKDHMVSALRRDRSWEWLTKDVLPAGEPTTNVIVVGTALHRDCIVCRNEITPGWASKKWQSVISWPKRMDLWREWESLLCDYDKDEEARQQQARQFYVDHQADMDEAAEVLWPEREPLYDLMVHRATIGPVAFESEKQNNPVDPSQCEWPEEYFTHANVWFDEWPALGEFTVRTLALDPSKGKSDRQGDYSAIIKYGRHKNGTEYIEADLRRGRMAEEMTQDLVRHYREFQPNGVALETVAFQELLLIPLRDAVKKSGIEGVPVYHFDHHLHKSVRIRQLSTPITQRRFRFKSRSPGTALLLQQMRDWPSTAHDDGPDALQMARQLAVELSNAKSSGRKVSV